MPHNFIIKKKLYESTKFHFFCRVLHHISVFYKIQKFSFKIVKRSGRFFHGLSLGQSESNLESEFDLHF
jgi:hypothetical protein